MSTERDWRPSASLGVIRQRADLLKAIRDFMQERAILEVETPVLSHAAVTDPHIHSFKTVSHPQDRPFPETLYLHTSPEYCMKRLLAAGSGPIYQITRVFRDRESGSRHQSEFTMLEWYRPGFDYHALMDEVSELMLVLGLADSHKQTYRDAFIHGIDQDPHLAGTEELQMLALKYGWESNSTDRDELLDFLFSMIVCPQLGLEAPVFVFDYPECQATLATIKSTAIPVAERFELFISGMEIANGFNELCNAKEQHHRFERDQELRKHTGKDMAPVDTLFLNALEHGLPTCAGVAVGIDRLLMALTGTKNIEDVLTFPDNRN